VFVGWNKATDGSGPKFMENTPVLDDITVYVQWANLVVFCIVSSLHGSREGNNYFINVIVRKYKNNQKNNVNCSTGYLNRESCQFQYLYLHIKY